MDVHQKNTRSRFPSAGGVERGDRKKRRTESLNIHAVSKKEPCREQNPPRGSCCGRRRKQGRKQECALLRMHQNQRDRADAAESCWGAASRLREVVQVGFAVQLNAFESLADNVGTIVAVDQQQIDVGHFGAKGAAKRSAALFFF
ncbi:hypothetical protein K239x_32440 [Planctomycetes bacterium K23_9]|uniref:Uncharacterized protein n=1 Tax=Stieleria marina TaxID=1930275 RepID=A0A517NVU6_9BACT|nr:hypothetical protein K239x_32440 [Planctomycetes bacterium K23_9]